jgi:hypothetical protein
MRNLILDLPVAKTELSARLEKFNPNFFSPEARKDWSRVLTTKDYAALIKSANRSR